MFNWIFYCLFRMVAQVYLYFADTAGHWKSLESSWKKDDISFNKYRIQNEGHERHFVFVDSFNLEDSLDWHQIIQFSDSILACTLRPVQFGNGEDPLDITDTVKEFSHYIYSNAFLTFNDLFSLFDINSDSQGHYNLMIIFDDLSEKECIVKGDDSLQMVFKKNNSCAKFM